MGAERRGSLDGTGRGIRDKLFHHWYDIPLLLIGGLESTFFVKTFGRVMLVDESAYCEESNGIVTAVIFYGLDDAFSDSLVTVLFFHGDEIDFFRFVGPGIGFKDTVTEHENCYGFFLEEYGKRFRLILANERKKTSFLFVNQHVNLADTAIKVREGLFEDIPLEKQLVPHHFHDTENLSGIFWGVPLVLAFSADFG